MPVRREDADRAQWTKLVANVSLNTVTALGRARVGAVFADPRAVGADAGARPRDRRRGPGRRGRRRRPARPRPTSPTPAGACRPTGGSSTLFDLEAGRRLEREALVGAVVSEGERLGVPVPVSRACDALLRLLSPPD